MKLVIVIAFLFEFSPHFLVSSEVPSPYFLVDESGSGSISQAAQSQSSSQHNNLNSLCGSQTSYLNRVSKSLLCNILPNLWARRMINHQTLAQQQQQQQQLIPAESNALVQHTFIEDLAKLQDDLIRSQASKQQQPAPNFMQIQPFDFHSVSVPQLTYSDAGISTNKQNQHQHKHQHQHQMQPQDMSGLSMDMAMANSMPFPSIPSSNLVEFPTQKTHFMPQQSLEQQFIDPAMTSQQTNPNLMPINAQDLSISSSMSNNNPLYQSLYPFPFLSPQHLASHLLPTQPNLQSANLHMWSALPPESLFPNSMLWKSDGWQKKRVNALKKLTSAKSQPKVTYKKLRVFGRAKTAWKPISVPIPAVSMPLPITHFPSNVNPNLIVPAVSLNPFLTYKTLAKFPLIKHTTVPFVINKQPAVTTPRKVSSTLSISSIRPVPPTTTTTTTSTTTTSTTTPSPTSSTKHDHFSTSKIVIQKFTKPILYSPHVRFTSPDIKQNPLVFPAKYDYYPTPSTLTTTSSPITTTKDYPQIVSEYLRTQGSSVTKTSSKPSSLEIDIDDPNHHKFIFRFNEKLPAVESIIDQIKAYEKNRSEHLQMQRQRQKQEETLLKASETDSSTFTKGYFEGILETIVPTEESINSTQFDYDELLNGTQLAVPGEPWLDYPMFSSMTATNFTCKKKSSGFYADVELKCQVYHHCGENKYHQRFICPNGTLYDQQQETCDYWFNVVCGQIGDSDHADDRKSHEDDIYIATDNYLLQQQQQQQRAAQRIDKRTELTTEPWLAINVGASIQVGEKNPNATLGFTTQRFENERNKPTTTSTTKKTIIATTSSLPIIDSKSENSIK